MYTVYNAKPAKVLGCAVFMLVFFGGQSKSNHWTPWSLNRFGVTGMGNNSNLFFCKREGADRPRERWREIQHGCNLVADIVWQTVSPVTCCFQYIFGLISWSWNVSIFLGSHPWWEIHLNHEVPASRLRHAAPWGGSCQLLIPWPEDESFANGRRATGVLPCHLGRCLKCMGCVVRWDSSGKPIKSSTCIALPEFLLRSHGVS